MEINQILSYFEAQSGLANFLQIGTFVVSCIFLVIQIAKWIKAKFFSIKYHSLESFVNSNAKRIPTEKTIKILILDDQLSDYPVTQLTRMGYQIEEKSLISLNEIESLRNFDVILLDIRGVLKEDLPRGGLEILKRLKDSNSGPYVIAVSSKGFDPTLAEFFMLANERLKKPIPQADIETAIQRAYRTTFSPLHAARRIDELLGTGNSKNGTARRNLMLIQTFLSGKIDKNKLRLHLEKSLGNVMVNTIVGNIDILSKALQ